MRDFDMKQHMCSPRMDSRKEILLYVLSAIFLSPSLYWSLLQALPWTRSTICPKGHEPPSRAVERARLIASRLWHPLCEVGYRTSPSGSRKSLYLTIAPTRILRDVFLSSSSYPPTSPSYTHATFFLALSRKVCENFSRRDPRSFQFSSCTDDQKRNPECSNRPNAFHIHSETPKTPRSKQIRSDIVSESCWYALLCSLTGIPYLPFFPTSSYIFTKKIPSSWCGIDISQN